MTQEFGTSAAAVAPAVAQADLKIGHYMLAGGPTEIAAAEEMQVQMEYRLAGTAAVVDDNAVTG
jgi:hypothetical protein